MMEIGVLSVGGTIDKVPGKKSAKAKDRIIGPPAVRRILKRMRLEALVTLHHTEVMRKDSLHMTDGDRLEVAIACSMFGSMRMLITHGTDTIVETATAIDAFLPGSQSTIVLTGAFFPAFKGNSSDASRNVALALGACMTAPPGVYIALNGIHRFDEVYKNKKRWVFQPKPR